MSLQNWRNKSLGMYQCFPGRYKDILWIFTEVLVMTLTGRSTSVSLLAYLTPAVPAPPWPSAADKGSAHTDTIARLKPGLSSHLLLFTYFLHKIFA